MKIKSIKLKNFKRFTDLSIEGLPETARLVVMIGPNGSGKSSVFDALLRLKILKEEHRALDSKFYYIKSGLLKGAAKEPEIEFHTPSPTTKQEWRKYAHVRSAYRNDLLTDRTLIRISPGVIDESRCYRSSNNDESVGLNYTRLLSQWIERSSTEGRPSETIGTLQSQIFGQLRDAIRKLFGDSQLVLDNLGDPVSGKVFQFDKGASRGLSYHHLSSGEKAVLDLLLDITVAKSEFNDTVFGIDEPEAHIHTKLQGPLLEELYNLIPDNSQLWIATHSVGMVRKAQDLWRAYPDSIVFLDFGGHDFDEPVTLTPVTPDPGFWARTYEVVLGDLAELVAPQQIVLCESKAQNRIKGFDAACYNQIFGDRYPDTRFISIGGREDVKKADTDLIPIIEAIARGVKILRLRDRDRATKQDMVNSAEKGIRILSRKYIDKYLIDNEVLTQLCVSEGKSDKVEEFLEAKDREIEKVMNDDKIHDKRRPIVQRIQEQAEQILELVHSGDTVESFMRDILAPRIQPGMKVYEELHEDIFGE